MSAGSRPQTSASLREMWRDPVERAKREGKIRSPELRAKWAETTRKSWQDPEIRAARIAAISKGMLARREGTSPSAKRRRAKAEQQRAMLARVPDWAREAGLDEVYVAIMRGAGEHEAARLCRLLRGRLS